jgi:UDP-N-acetylmuramate dehydrogenase
MKIIENLNLREYNAYNIESICKKAYFPESEDDIVELLKAYNGQIVILGNGNNVILSKDYYEDNFIVFNGCFDKIEIDGDFVCAQAGATMLQLSEFAYENSLSGLEIFYDIPSSIGGAVVMNAGASGEEVKDLLVKVTYLDSKNACIKEINVADIDYGYRNSFFQKNPYLIVLKAWFKLHKGNKKTIKDKMESSKEMRWLKQPREFPNCGSVYKRPPGRYVGPMLDELGLKGYTVGGAKISEKHSGFIINTGNATGSDILAIIKETRRLVKEKFSIDLEVEQRII